MRVAQINLNSFENSIVVRQYLSVPEANNPIAFRLKKLCTASIRLFLASMLAAVEFDYKPAFGRAEIHNKRADEMLMAELYAVDLPAA